MLKQSLLFALSYHFFATGLHRIEKREPISSEIFYITTNQPLKTHFFNYGSLHLGETVLELDTFRYNRTVLYSYIRSLDALAQIGFLKCTLQGGQMDPADTVEDLPVESAYINNIEVDNDFQCCGIGTILLKSCITLCKFLEYKNIYLHVAKHNERACKLYKTLGFTSIDEPNYEIFKLGPAFACMVKSIDEKKEEF